MKLEHWMQLVFGTAILGAIGFLATNLFDIKGILSGVSVKVESTNNRVNRIADALPEVKARVAWEEIYHQIAGFVASTRPEKTANNKWVTKVTVYDAKAQAINFYSLALDESHKHYASYVIAGKVKAENPYAPSFSDLVYHSSYQKEPVSIPISINLDTSYVLRKADMESYNVFLRSISDNELKETKYGLIRNWKELSAKLPELSDKLSELSDKLSKIENITDVDD